MKVIFICLVSIGFSCSLFSQKNTITGIVFDQSTKKPISFANVCFADNPNIGTYTDINGFFKIDIGDFDILKSAMTISSLGYKPMTYLKNKNKATDSIFLAKEIYDLNEISVTPKIYDRIELRPNKKLSLDYNLGTQRSGISLQIGTAFTENQYTGILSKVKLYIKSNQDALVTSRLRIYSMASKAPQKDILNDDVFVNLNKSEDYIEINLDKFNIGIDGDFFVAIEFLIAESKNINKSNTSKTTIQFTKCKKEYAKKYTAFQKINGGEWKKYEPVEGELFVPYLEVEMKIEKFKDSRQP